MVIADDSAIVRDGVAALLRECGVHVAGLATDPESLYREIERHRPDVALVDIRMPPTGTNEGLVAAEHIGREYPEVGVLVLSQYLELAYALRLVEGQEARRGYLHQGPRRRDRDAAGRRAPRRATAAAWSTPRSSSAW